MLHKRCLVIVLTVLLSGAWVGASLEPGAAVALDFRWMNAPTVSASVQPVSVQQTDGYVLLQGTGAGPSSYEWSLRHPIPAKAYPVLVLRYRAHGIHAGPQAPRVLQVQVDAPGQVHSVLSGVAAGELVQDGRMHELRQHLSPPGGGMISALRATLIGDGGSARLELWDLRFEAPEGSTGGTAAATLERKQEFVVSDGAGKPLAGAEVRFGLLERGNWTAAGRTDAEGKVILSALAPLAPTEQYGASSTAPASVPLEAAISKEGFIAQYIAPIEGALPGPLTVDMQLAGAIAGGSRPQALPPVSTPESAAAIDSQSAYADTAPLLEDYERAPRDAYYDYAPPYYDYYDPGYRYGGGWPYGFVWYVVVKDDKGKHCAARPTGHSADQAWWRGRQSAEALPPGQRDWRVVPWGREGRGAAGRQGSAPAVDASGGVPEQRLPARAPTHVVPGAPTEGIVSAPRTGVISAPGTGVISAPRSGVITAPVDAPAAAPGQGIVTAPRGNAPVVRERTGLTHRRVERGSSDRELRTRMRVNTRPGTAVQRFDPAPARMRGTMDQRAATVRSPMQLAPRSMAAPRASAAPAHRSGPSGGVAMAPRSLR